MIGITTTAFRIVFLKEIVNFYRFRRSAQPGHLLLATKMSTMRIFKFLLFILLWQKGFAQRTISSDFETWWGLMTSVQVSNKLSIWNDFHHVPRLFIIYRTGITFHPRSDNFVTTAGYSYLELTAPFSDGKLIRPEHRPWMQTIYRVPSTKKLSTSFRFRYDARFIRDLKPGAFAETYSFNHRWRFNNSLRYNWGDIIAKDTRFFTTMLNESLITTGPGPNGAPFEHRTHFLAQFGKGNFIYSLGYIVRYVDVNPSLARVNHGPVIWLTMNLNLMKPKLQTFVEYPGDHSQ
jgi:hypothetical protein